VIVPRLFFTQIPYLVVAARHPKLSTAAYDRSELEARNSSVLRFNPALGWIFGCVGLVARKARFLRSEAEHKIWYPL
jgi:hypothetical protein